MNQIKKLQDKIDKQIKNNEKYQILKSYEYICPFCGCVVKFNVFNQHNKSNNCKLNKDLFIKYNSEILLNEKINLIKRYRNFIIKNYNNNHLINNFFNEISESEL
jgi:hypothetical protein